jgi:dihydrofolate reductase
MVGRERSADQVVDQFGDSPCSVSQARAFLLLKEEARRRLCAVGLLTFALNVTLDGCNDHREMIADDELHEYFTDLMGTAGAMLYGRTTYELMESFWPAVARDEKAPRALRQWAVHLEAKPKYVVSSTRRDFPWSNTFRVEGGLPEAVKQLKESTPRGVLVGSPRLSLALERLGLIDEYRVVVHPVVAGHGPTLFQGLERSRHLALLSTKTLKSGVIVLHLRCKEATSRDGTVAA